MKKKLYFGRLKSRQISLIRELNFKKFIKNKKIENLNHKKNKKNNLGIL